MFELFCSNETILNTRWATADFGPSDRSVSFGLKAVVIEDPTVRSSYVECAAAWCQDCSDISVRVFTFMVISCAASFITFLFNAGAGGINIAGLKIGGGLTSLVSLAFGIAGFSLWYNQCYVEIQDAQVANVDTFSDVQFGVGFVLVVIAWIFNVLVFFFSICSLATKDEETPATYNEPSSVTINNA